MKKKTFKLKNSLNAKIVVKCKMGLGFEVTNFQHGNGSMH